MSDLISRSELKKSIQADIDMGDNVCDTGYLNAMYMCIEYIDNAPTVPLPDFKAGYKQAILDGKTNFSKLQGEWEFDREFTEFGNPYGTYKCNQCGGHSSDKYPFCFWCGAKMKGDSIQDG